MMLKSDIYKTILKIGEEGAPASLALNQETLNLIEEKYKKEKKGYLPFSLWLVQAFHADLKKYLEKLVGTCLSINNSK